MPSGQRRDFEPSYPDEGSDTPHRPDVSLDVGRLDDAKKNVERRYDRAFAWDRDIDTADKDTPEPARDPIVLPDAAHYWIGSHGVADGGNVPLGHSHLWFCQCSDESIPRHNCAALAAPGDDNYEEMRKERRPQRRHRIRRGSRMDELNRTPARPIRLYQCPGCWSWGMHKVPPTDGSLECDCGERLACIDLRGEHEGDRAVWDVVQHGTLIR